MRGGTEKPIVFARFLDDAIVGEGGRLVFAILNAFAGAGYRVYLFDDMDFGELGRPGQLIYGIPGLTLVRRVPEDANAVYLFDREHASSRARKWKKKVRVRFDIFSSYAASALIRNPPIMMPFPMHPSNYCADMTTRLDDVRNREKRFRILFAGDSRGYVKNRITYPKPKLTRLDVIGSLHESLEGILVLVSTESELAEISSGPYLNRFVLVNTGTVWVRDWLPCLGAADFFLCPPGITMPMSHNSVESLALGVIPITNYPEWFSPELIDMENCITFENRKGLRDAVRRALALSTQEVSRMRAAALRYYEEHLAPAGFISKIISSPREKVTVLMMTEANSVNNSAKLGPRSVLLRDTSRRTAGF